ncbi:MAG: ATP-dependent zinc metalloprotease FtsH [Candidatus Obscuribacterales bacterium]|nr:ATP-dependent zinc metalloprotease FtsH [Candidatus Obscuribacterales bacterium]
MSEDKTPEAPKLESWIWILILSFWLSLGLSNLLASSQQETIPYSKFLAYVQESKIDDLLITKDEIAGQIKDPKAKIKRFRTVRIEDPQLASRMAEHQIKFQGMPEDNFWKGILSWVLPFLVMFLIWSFILSRVAGKDGGLGPGLMGIEKSRARVYMESNIKTTFEDLAGVDEAKAELQEIIGFLKEPAKYNRLGAHLPKGILLVGPPGTGKTLLARAVAGEAAVPFFSISGSEFVEMFVGVGAARVRDLFAQASKSAPCIIFIDELDALGRSRGLNPMAGGHDEKEQTLNQLLVEMDGFDPKQGVVLLAATNRPEILDAALLRAGRFDRHILVDRPDKIGRVEILKVHLRNVQYAQDLDLEQIAAATAGFTGADLANLVNEAVLLATRSGAASVNCNDFNAALERVVAGLEKKNRLLNPKERRVVAFHEMGHALVGLSIPGMDPIQKVSIIPRGIAALGYTIQRPTEDRFLMSKEELKNKLAVLLGGRAAEMLVFDDISTGAADDLSKATDLARSMVARYGMETELGPVSYEADAQPFLNNPYSEPRQFSEETAREIDCAVRDLIKAALEHALEILKEHRAELEKSANELLLKESLSREDLLEVFSRNGSNNIELKAADALAEIQPG